MKGCAIESEVRNGMNDPRDYKLDVTSLPAPADSEDASSSRPYLSVQFACCNVYMRIYRSADGHRYEGRCPRCARPVRFMVGPGGTNQRTFVVE
jgi:hypothetical protein